MRAWYDIQAFDLHARQDENGMRASLAEVEALIERETARGVAARHILLAGFSQGGAIALATALRHRQALAGVIALSTYLPLQAHSAAERSMANARLPVFMGHGRLDPIVPMALGLRSRDALAELGHAVDWHSYVMAHQVCPEEIADLRAWIGVRLRGAPE
jgi:phospholipase/carboxylesterase